MRTARRSAVTMPGGGVAKGTQQLTLQAGQQKTGVDVTMDLGS